jgi:hypothetical protein
MYYSRIYIELMERASDRILDGYTEKHHIVPKCMGGDNKPRNIAVLTPEEHYIAHKLLVKIYPHNSKLVYAANYMSASSDNHCRNNRDFGWMKRRLSKAMTGNQYRLNKPHTDTTKRKISIANSSPSIVTRNKMSSSRKARITTNETKLRMSEAHMGLVASDITKQKMREAWVRRKSNNQKQFN